MNISYKEKGPFIIQSSGSYEGRQNLKRIVERSNLTHIIRLNDFTFEELFQFFYKVMFTNVTRFCQTLEKWVPSAEFKVIQKFCENSPSPFPPKKYWTFPKCSWYMSLQQASTWYRVILWKRSFRAARQHKVGEMANVLICVKLLRKCIWNSWKMIPHTEVTATYDGKMIWPQNHNLVIISNWIFMPVKSQI